jgi:hypothetical protein
MGDRKRMKAAVAHHAGRAAGKAASAAPGCIGEAIAAEAGQGRGIGDSVAFWPVAAHGRSGAVALPIRAPQRSRGADDLAGLPAALPREVEQQRFVARKVVEDCGEKGRVARRLPDRIGLNPRQSEETAEPLRVSSKEGKCFDRQRFRAFALAGNGLSAHVFAFL